MRCMAASAPPDTHPPPDTASCGCCGTVPPEAVVSCRAACIERRRASSCTSERKRRLLMYNRWLCRGCGTAIPTPGPRRCEACRTKDREANRTRKQRLRDERKRPACA